MPKIIDLILDLLKNKEYSKINKTLMGIFVFVAPSIIYIFIYKRELIFGLDIIKLLVLCITFNLTFIILMHFFSLTCNILKYDIADKNIYSPLLNKGHLLLKTVSCIEENNKDKSNEVLLNECKCEINKIEQIKLEAYSKIKEDSIFDCVLIISAFVTTIFIRYVLSNGCSIFNMADHSDNVTSLLSLMLVVSGKCTCDGYKILSGNVLSKLKKVGSLVGIDCIIIILIIVSTV